MIEKKKRIHEVKKNEKLSRELMLSVFENPWHGASVKDILDGITFEQAYLRPIQSAHSIIELTLHISAWIEETLSRVNGNTHADPVAGDWPIPQFKNEEYWQTVKKNLFASTNKLITAVKNFPETKLDELVGNEKNASLGTGFSYERLIIGLVQHNAYHSGQIALIKKSF